MALFFPTRKQFADGEQVEMEALAAPLRAKTARARTRVRALFGLLEHDLRRRHMQSRLLERLQKLDGEQGVYNNADERWLARMEVQQMARLMEGNGRCEGLLEEKKSRWCAVEAAVPQRRMGAWLSRHPLLRHSNWRVAKAALRCHFGQFPEDKTEALAIHGDEGRNWLT